MGRKLPRICVECHNIAKVGTNRCADHPPKRSPSSQATSRSDWKRVRQEALARDLHTCQVCGAPATQVDHIVSVAQGGTSEITNTRSVCADCNQAARPGYSARQSVAAKLADLEHQQATPSSGMSGLLSEPGQ